MIKGKKEVINLALFLVGTLITALTYSIFVVPNNYMVGGVSGVAVIFNYLFNINVSTTLLIGDVVLSIIGIIVLGFKDTAPSIVGGLVYTLMVYLTENINGVLNVSLSSPFLNIVTIGILFGIGYTMIYLAGYSSGGADILGIIFAKKLGVPLGKALLYINIIVYSISAFIFGFESLVIALIIRYLESAVIDNFLIGKSDSKVLFISTNKQEELKKYIINDIKSGISEINVTSGYQNKSGKILMCVVPTEKYIILKDKIKKIDKKAFITIIDAYEVYGGTNKYRLFLHDYRV